MTTEVSSPQYALFLAVLPKYRQACIDNLVSTLGEKLEIYVSDSHLDETVKTGVSPDLYQSVPLVRLLRKKVFVQGGVRHVLGTPNLVVDLNPRSLSSWILLAARKLRPHKRTLVWGHIHPQAGVDSKTAPLRLAMRRLADGTISYTYRDRAKALADLPKGLVWVAPNSLYPHHMMVPPVAPGMQRNSLLYVGRFEPAKKVDLLVRGFALAAASLPELRLTLVGGGSELPRLEELVGQLGIEAKVTFAGWIDDPNILKSHYSTAIASTSTGFAGLGLTQSLGFGIPMIVAKNEQHSPEIELADSGGVTWFESDSAESLAEAIRGAWLKRDQLPDSFISEFTKRRYSAEAMADGLRAALQGSPQTLPE
ncbi:UNVERIFIED_ORG: glycosyltransferase involved in cell wall biosynthesis [Paenarthrobacter nicotinovorans]